MGASPEDERIVELSAQVERLHAALQKRGINTKGTKDIFGREFEFPVDGEHKATVFNCATLMSCSNPHMRGFWASAIGFFCTFFSTFAAAPLMAFIKKPESLNLQKADIVSSAIASVAGTIGMRLITGWLCEKLGARKAFVFILLLAVPGIIGIAFTTNAAGFITCRFLIGLGLATFVACQVWCSQLFSRSIVGATNATAGGWGNLGGGITNLIMPFIMLGFLSATDEDENLSWRLCYIVPLAMHLAAAMYVLTGRDLPDGNFSELESSGAKQKADSSVSVKTGTTNVNAYILTLTYGFCFGVELTMTNVAALYFYTDHGLSPQLSGVFASLFGLMNLFARSTGGILSDAMNKKYGMRGRLWAMWIVQVIEGAFCLIMGVITLNYEAPVDNDQTTVALFEHSEDNAKYPDVPYNLCEGHDNYRITTCGTLSIATKSLKKICQLVDINGTRDEYETTEFSLPKRILVADINAKEYDRDCIMNADLSGIVVLVMIFFSTCVQMAEGLHFGVVPYVSRPALGIVSGMVGAGGNAGAVLTLWTIFKQVDRSDTGFMILGAVVMASSLVMFGIYFPKEGGMLFKPGGLGTYDPQRWKPPADFRGADQMDYQNVAEGATNTSTEKAVPNVAAQHA